MRIHSGIFIHDREIIILIDDLEWEILCFDMHFLYFPVDLDDITSVYLFILYEALPIIRDTSPLDHLLNIRPRNMGENPRKIRINTSGLTGIGEDREKGSVHGKKVSI